MHPAAIIPTKRTEDAAYDIYPCFMADYLQIDPHETELVPTGIRVKIPTGYYLHFKGRGSTGMRGMTIQAGVIDEGYTGELFVAITNSNSEPLYIVKPNSGIFDGINYPYEKAICQAMLLPVPPSVMVEVDESVIEDYQTERGAGRLGSSGK